MSKEVNEVGASNAVVMRHLGKDVNYPQKYDPTVLVKEPRATNRALVGFDLDKPLPFAGHDVWRCWEMTCINKRTGEPEVGIFRICYDANSEYIVESKSLKLYTFSFNNEEYENGLWDVLDIMRKDLSELLGVEVSIDYFPTTYQRSAELGTTFNKEKWLNIDRDLFNGMDAFRPLMQLHTTKLRSLCRVTSQPDMGDCYVSITLKNEMSMQEVARKFKQIVLSYRNQNHFHEESCEGIWKEMNDFLGDNMVELVVSCLYTRRGGIDINSYRYNVQEFNHHNVMLGKDGIFKTSRQ